MVNQIRLIVVIGIGIFFGSIANADERSFLGTDSLSGLDLFDDTYGPSDSRCGLGFIGYGSPVVVTRVSAWSRAGWVEEADQLVEINGVAISQKSDLHSALDTVSANDKISLVVLRDESELEINALCQESTPILEAREEALIGVSEGRWQACMSATIMEEIRWGGPNSQSAGLRLWCHQAQLHRSFKIEEASSSLSRLHAQLIYDYARLLLDELQYVPNGLEDFRSTLKTRIQLLDESSSIRSHVSANIESVSAVTR